jgi:hypothetical protein
MLMLFLTFCVSAPAAVTESVFGSTVPAQPAASDTRAVTVGVVVTAKRAGAVTGVRFYKGSTNTGTHVGGVYSSDGRQLATATFGRESDSGWQTLQFTTPVRLSAGQTVTAAVFMPHGRYAVNNPYRWPASSNSINATRGVYRYGYQLTNPTSVYGTSNYFVDVSFVPSTTGSDPTTSPTTPTTSPTTAAPSPTATSTPTTAAPSPTATSTPTTTAPPSGSSKPGPTNTGVPAGTTLTTYTGPLIITTAGTVIDSKDVRGALIIRAKNVVIRNSKIHDDMGAVAGINVQDGGSATITDSEIYNFEVGIVYGNWTATRINMHDISFDGSKIGSNAQLLDSWIHSPKPTSDAHWDGVQVQGGVTNTVIKGNNIESTGADTNSAVFIADDLGPSTNGPLTVTGNWLNGGNYTIYANPGRGGYSISNISITNNRFGHDAKYGPAYVSVPVTWSGNVWDDTGKTVNY